MERHRGTARSAATGHRRWVGAVVAAVVLAPMAAAVGAVGRPATATASTPTTQYYLALGDSLAAGVGASTTATRYVNVLYQHELGRFPGLQLVDLACSGATTGSVLHGPGCAYTSGTQLGDAEAFLQAHPGQVAFATIDIGANNVDGCLSGTGINLTCMQSGLTHLTTELPEILGGLEAADPGLAVYGTDYYDPFLGLWVTGPTGQSLAQQSEPLAVTLNGQLAQLFAASGAATADPATLFQTDDVALTGTYLGQTVPQNVADICNWTLYCSGGGNIHANDIGHGLVAQAFAQVIDTPAVVPSALPTATRGTPYVPFTLAASGIGPSASPYGTTLRWTKVSLPRGMHLSRTGVLSGTPSKALAAGVTTVTVRVTETVTTLNGTRKVRTRSSVEAVLPLALA